MCDEKCIKKWHNIVKLAKNLMYRWNKLGKLMVNTAQMSYKCQKVDKKGGN